MTSQPLPALLGARWAVVPSVATSPFLVEMATELVTVSPQDQAVHITLLVLGAGPAQRADIAVIAEAVSTGGTLIPIVLGHEASDALPDLSQILVADRLPRQVAQQVAGLMGATGEELVELQDLVAAATQWEVGGRRADHLLSSGQAARGTALLAVAGRVGVGNPTLLRQFVTTSVVHGRRRQRRLRSILTGASLVLLALAILAAVSRVAAVQAADTARLHAGISASSRLVRQVEEMLASAPDPDLPLLLAAEALDAAATPAAIDISRRVLNRIPAHQTVTLPTNARWVAAATHASTIAVALVDRRLLLLDGANVTRRLDPLEGDTQLRPTVRPDGKIVAFVGGEAVWFVDPRTEQPPDRITLPAGASAFAGQWVGEAVVVLTAAGPLRVDIEGRVMPWGQFPWRDDIRAMDISVDGSLVAMASRSHGVWLGDPITGTVRWASTDTDVWDVTISNEHSVVLRRPQAEQRLQLDTGEITAEPYRGSQIALARNVGGGLASLSRDGSVCHLDPRTGESLQCHPAHAGGVVDLAVADGGLVTIGLDGRLRLWGMPALPQSLAPYLRTPPAQSMLDRLGEYHAGQRNKLAVSPDGRKAGLLLPAVGGAVTFDPGALSLGAARFQGIYFGQYSAVLSEDGQYVADVRDGRVTVRHLNSDTQWEVTGRFTTEGDLARPTPVAVSADGEQVVHHRAGQALTAVRRAVRHLETEPNQNPVTNWIDDQGRTSAVFANGLLRREHSESTWLVRPPLTVTAATFDHNGDPVLIDSAGTLIAYFGGTKRDVTSLPPGLTAEAIRVAPDGSSIAVLGGRRALVVDATSGEPQLHIQVFAPPEVIQDVAFLPDGQVLAIRLDGRLQKYGLTSSAEVQDGVRAALPRTLTDDERALFELGG